MGYDLEEILLGHGLHLFMDYAKSSIPNKLQQQFTAKSLHFELKKEHSLGKHSKDLEYPGMTYTFK
jgi:hypothetical protein